MTTISPTGISNLVRALLCCLIRLNMTICFEDQKTGRCLNEIPSGDSNFTTKMRIIDFGSALDEFTLKHLCGSTGLQAEQTNAYTPPEALLNASWHQAPISAYTHSLLDQHLEGWNDNIKDVAYKLRPFMELCILVPGGSPKHHRATS